MFGAYVHQQGNMPVGIDLYRGQNINTHGGKIDEVCLLRYPQLIQYHIENGGEFTSWEFSVLTYKF